MLTQTAAYPGRQQMNCRILLFHIEILHSVKRFVTLLMLCFCEILLFICCHGIIIIIITRVVATLMVAT